MTCCIKIEKVKFIKLQSQFLFTLPYDNLWSVYTPVSLNSRLSGSIMVRNFPMVIATEHSMILAS
jgi:hypothetical protein